MSTDEYVPTDAEVEAAKAVLDSVEYADEPQSIRAAYRRLLLDPPAPVTPEWHNARIVEATAGGSDRVEWARTEDGYWVSLGGIARTVASSALSDVSIIIPGEVEA